MTDILALDELERYNQDKCHHFFRFANAQNFDGGFGSVPGAESHSGQIFCCVGALSITSSLHLLELEKLSWWLAERQLPTGGLNGRPEKLQDVCYSWWVLASLHMLGRGHWIDSEALKR